MDPKQTWPLYHHPDSTGVKFSETRILGVSVGMSMCLSFVCKSSHCYPALPIMVTVITVGTVCHHLLPCPLGRWPADSPVHPQ